MDEETKNAQHYFAKGVNEASNGEYEKAIASFTEALRLDPQDARAYYNRGTAKGRRRRYEDAINDFDEAIRLDPQHVLSFINRGNAKGSLGRHEDALRDYDEAIRLDPRDAKAYYGKGRAKLQINLVDEAAENFKTFVKLADRSLDQYIKIAKSIIHEIGKAKKTGEPVEPIEAPSLLATERSTETDRRAVMFLDICDSTETLYKQGDHHYVKIFLKWKRIFYAELGKYNSVFKKNLGDGFMATFKDPADAVRAAKSIVKLVKESDKVAKDDEKINIRVGIDYGQVELDKNDNDDCYGLTVVTAQRIEGLKKESFTPFENDKIKENFPDKNRILVSDTVYDLLKHNSGFNFTEVGHAKLKGFGKKLDYIYMVEC